MKAYKVTGKVATLQSSQLQVIDQVIYALSPHDVYLAITGEENEQADMFDAKAQLPGDVFFCGMIAGDNSWACPFTGGLICVVDK